MGQIMRAKCTACTFEKDLFVGGGMRDCNLDVILSPLPENVREIVEKAVRGGAGRAVIERPLCVCGSCGTICAPTAVTFTSPSFSRTFYSVCDGCGASGYIQIGEDETAACPACGTALSIEPVGHWD
ncbi:MAG: hypothetical protein IJF15_05200 [Oscillospiraceae bacterium]|nr:hypothetical protein [Oscillospiraceae bacterium]